MKKFNRKSVYYKITNQEENHNGLQYHTGRVVDILPFNDNPEDSCVPGGIYFTDKDHILKFVDYGPWVRPLTIPKGVKVILDPEGDKFRAHEVEMQERVPLAEFIKTVDMSKRGGVDLRSLTTLSDVKFENQGYVYLNRLTTIPDSVSFGEGVTKVWMNRETTDEELARLSKKYTHVEFERW